MSPRLDEHIFRTTMGKYRRVRLHCQRPENPSYVFVSVRAVQFSSGSTGSWIATLEGTYTYVQGEKTIILFYKSDCSKQFYEAERLYLQKYTISVPIGLKFKHVTCGTLIFNFLLLIHFFRILPTSWLKIMFIFQSC